jgi:hypothetical protein
MEGMLALWASGVETDTVGGVDVVWDVRGDACGCVCVSRVAALESTGVTKVGVPLSGVLSNLVIVDATSLPPITVTDAFTEWDSWKAGRPFVIWAVRRRSLQLRYHDGTCMTRYTSRTAE